jgi:hypothetical protein
VGRVAWRWCSLSGDRGVGPLLVGRVASHHVGSLLVGLVALALSLWRASRGVGPLFVGIVALALS